MNNPRASKIICLLLAFSLTETAIFTVEKSESPIKVLANQNVVIPCMITGYTTPQLDLSNLVVKWTHKSSNGSTHDLYEFNNNIHNRIKKDLIILENKLLYGDAGLHIPRVWINDEGNYRCDVFSTPHHAEGLSTLQVSAVPTTTLMPSTLEIETGTEKSITCEVNRFYPEQLKIQWVQHLKNSTRCTLEKRICTGSPVINPDGTYNATSQLTIIPSMIDDGDVFSCNVQHRSMENGRVLNITLVVKVSPKLSEITGNENLNHMSRATLTCQISAFRPKPIGIMIKIKNQAGKNINRTYTWEEIQNQQNNISQKKNNDGDCRVDIPLTENEPMLNEDYNAELNMEMKPTMKSNKDGTFSCQCNIKLTPNIEECNDAELFVYVTHKSLREQSYISCRLKVIGVAPKLSDIVAPLRMIHGERLALTCPINGFKPRPLAITWLKKDSHGQENQLLKYENNKETFRDSHYSHILSENEHNDHSFSVLSIITVRAQIEDNGTTYICRTYHSATQETSEKSLEMNVLALPQMDNIQSSEDILYAGEKIHLSCKIHSFFPQPVTVCWYKDNTTLPCNNDDILSQANKLLHFTSRLLYVPDIKDLNKTFRCEVKHSSLEEPKSVTWKIKKLISKPRIPEIRCESGVPECNKLVKLSCSVRDYYPDECTIRWYSRKSEINGKDKTWEDKESGLFNSTTEMELIPTAKDHGTEVHLEVTHSKMMSTTKTFLITLEGFPIFESIYTDKTPKYGELLTICCKVKSGNLQDIKAEWLENRDPVKSSMVAETQKEKDVILYRLKFIPTAEDYAQVFTCLLQHRNIPEPLKKHLNLRLPEKSPSLSEITIFPSKPEINKETCFKVNISGFAPKGIQVKWYNEFIELSENISTSKPTIQKDGLYSCLSDLRYTPNKNDLGRSIRCEVTHTASRKTNEKRYVLQLENSSYINGNLQKRIPQIQNASGNRSSKPQIMWIKCMSENPKRGEDVTLTAFIKDLNVNNGTFCWQNGIYPIDDDQIQNSDQQDGSGCLSTVTFKTENSDSQCEITLEVTSNFESMEKSYSVKLS
ncbi:natural cytotoxicity triggering receptor 3 ligand 1 isoform X2 [Bombina bombina]|uniref:natural cytotoxicity triggering receptor 3 ligand 1 isoform X2 n=1 Tax=Bombina bombina TaxID=8345 RepID=UPI00235AE0E5|nr:natural cytotoxicity triggering receptor 3 ligand 1 isoform X2 [Bombina bombina]